MPSDLVLVFYFICLKFWRGLWYIFLDVLFFHIHMCFNDFHCCWTRYKTKFHFKWMFIFSTAYLQTIDCHKCSFDVASLDALGIKWVFQRLSILTFSKFKFRHFPLEVGDDFQWHLGEKADLIKRQFKYLFFFCFFFFFWGREFFF